jgi:hypothetical protein
MGEPIPYKCSGAEITEDAPRGTCLPGAASAEAGYLVCFPCLRVPALYLFCFPYLRKNWGRRYV